MSYASYLVGLGALCTLNDVEFDLIAFFEALVAFALNRRVVDEDIGPIVTTKEAVSLCIVKPLNRSLVLCHVPNSLCSV
jgi:hypothetical protein